MGMSAQTANYNLGKKAMSSYESGNCLLLSSAMAKAAPASAYAKVVLQFSKASRLKGR
jgi:hypothetical protein